MNSVKELFFL